MLPKNRLELLIILGTLTAFGPLSIDMYLPALPTLEVVLSAQTAQVQLTLTAFFLGFAFGQGLYGPLADRFGRKMPLYFSLTLYAAASLACAFAPSVEALVALRFLQAIGGCAGGVISRAIARDLFNTQQMRRVLSMLMLVTGIAPVLAPLLGGQLLVRFGWQSIFWVQAAIGIICLAAVHFRLPETHPPDATQVLRLGQVFGRYRALLSNRIFLINALMGGISMAGMFAYIAGSPFVFINLFGVPADQFGLLFGLNALGLVLASQSNAHLFHATAPDRVLFRAIVVQCMAGLLLLAAAVTGAAGLPGIAVPLFVYVSCVGLVMPNATTLAMEPYAKDAGAASAMLGMLQFLLAALATMVVGALEPLAEGALPMAGVIAFTGLAALTLALFYNRHGAVSSVGEGHSSRR
ncbi:MAG: Bcr/CflA family drug resistance efflux transporter [Chloroflexi bacterium]|nr:Bcr/CflA family drug resistance efflux transporter [Chloroflexota bacterium]MDL1885036.1 Bcr/CflA family multidrug efflux MFS transporter [Anaerolineae bacterium CFX8]